MTSIVGVSAYDTLSRRAMLLGLKRVPGGGAASPFVRLFYSEPSAYIWEDDDEWFTQSVKGKAVSRVTPSCHSYSASASTQHWKRFNGGCVRMNDFSRTWMTCVWCHSRTGHGMHTTVAEQELWTHAKIRIHAGKTHMWNTSGRMPEGVTSCSGERCCTIRQHRSGEGPISKRDPGIKVLGCPLGHRTPTLRNWRQSP